ncbi:MAG: zinc-ribbon domain-containing protein [SAR202 cluster bacterium]|nr:zinc-ribbon domain-containing protein [SAR202 cluster bacterium]
MKCSRCGRENPPGSNFCASCGTSLAVAAAVRCPTCGHENRPGALECAICHAVLGAPPATPTVESVLGGLAKAGGFNLRRAAPAQPR